MFAFLTYFLAPSEGPAAKGTDTGEQKVQRCFEEQAEQVLTFSGP